MGSVVETRVIRVDPQQFDPAALDPAVEALRNGGLVGMPTDTVYGVAANLDHPDQNVRSDCLKTLYEVGCLLVSSDHATIAPTRVVGIDR